ncbi:gliding motility-associated peptidyl-prolyl isomerase GldI [Allomuricauda sp. d1]|uniref:gliding motility-associated peptidyl-prolyl isomerase GldI n=1 Tax=Allomuricauda sp. d1 TaxID=3136725 RepID=UPI0031DFE110
MKQLIFILIACFVVSCGGPEPRKPVEVKSGSFFKESVERSKRLLTKEQAAIQKIIERDTLHEYLTSANGFSYYFDAKEDSLAPLPETDDKVLLTYNVTTFGNDTLYTSDEIGVFEMLVDKEQLFQGLRSAIKLMREGEKATFLFPSSLAYGYLGDGNKIAPATPIKSTVTLLKIEQKQDSIN